MACASRARPARVCRLSQTLTLHPTPYTLTRLSPSALGPRGARCELTLTILEAGTYWLRTAYEGTLLPQPHGKACFVVQPAAASIARSLLLPLPPPPAAAADKPDTDTELPAVPDEAGGAPAADADAAAPADGAPATPAPPAAKPRPLSAAASSSKMLLVERRGSVRLMAYDAHHNAIHAPQVPATARLIWSESAEAEITSSLAEISARGDPSNPAYIVTYWYLSRKSASTAALPPSEVWLCVELSGEALPLLLVSTDPPPPRAITAAVAEANVKGPSDAAKAAEAAAKQAKLNEEAVAKLSDKLKAREGGWFGLFKHMDADGGGEIEFAELEDLARNTTARPSPSP